MPSNSKIRVDLAYSVFLETMEDEGYCYFDTDHDTPPKPTWVEIVRTGVSYGTIIYAVPQEESKDA